MWYFRLYLCGASQGPCWCKAKQSRFSWSTVSFFLPCLLCLVFWWLTGCCSRCTRNTALSCNFGFKTDHNLCRPIFFSRPGEQCIVHSCSVTFSLLTLVDMRPHKRLQSHTNLFNSFLHVLRFFFSRVLTYRRMMEKTLHPVCSATLHVIAWWVMSSIVRPIACGWSSTATPPEPIRASASHTQVSCLRNLYNYG